MDEFEHSDGSVQLTRLQPGYYYGIRAVSTNAAGNSTYSRLIQVQTVPKEGKRGDKVLSGPEPHVKRTVSGRRASQPPPSYDQLPVPSSHDLIGSRGLDVEETIAILTRRLDMLRQQKEEVETQYAQELEDSEKQRSSLTEERDTLKRAVDEKERTSQDLRRQVNDLEKQSKTIQRRRQAKEKTLQQKKAERQKMRDDVERWMNDSVEMQGKAETLRSQKVEVEEAHAKKMEQARDQIEATYAGCRALEEEIRDWGIKIKHLEDDRKKADKVQSEEEVEADRREKDEELRHEARMQEMQSEYTYLWKMNADVSLQSQQNGLQPNNIKLESQIQVEQESVNRMLDPRANDLINSASAHGFDYSAVYAPQRRTRQSSNRLSSSTYGSAYSPHAGFAGPTGLQNPLQSGPFHSFSPPSRAGTGFSDMSPRDFEDLTAGAPMSPTANNLLPSYLLGDDDLPGNSASLASRPMIDTLGHRSPPFEQTSQDPQSPLSMHSASPSLLSSPHESFTNAPLFPTDSDRQSLGSTGSPYNQSITATSGPVTDRRRASLFNFGRQRQKSSVPELPPFGSLKPSQSQSFPTNEQEANGAGPSRKKLGSNIWSSPMGHFLNRGSSTGIESDTGPAPLPRKTRRGLFGSKLDPSETLSPSDRSSSPRPSSTYSHENVLPRPSSDSQPFGWPNQDIGRQRNSPLGSNWSSIGNNRSRNPSRRQSVQHGSTSNLSLGSTPLDPDDAPGSFGVPKAPQPAPIGTERFTLSKNKEKAPKLPKQLNPAAPTFKTRLGFTKKTSKAEGDAESSTSKSKSKSKDTEKPSSQSRSSDAELLSEDSHSSPRLSRDAYSISTSTSREGLGDNLEQTASNAHSDLQPPSISTSTPSSSVTKESLMQRITRKSSSSKFSTAWRERGSIFSSKKSGEPSTPGDVDEGGEGSDYLAVGGKASSEVGTPGDKDGKEKDGTRSGRPSLSWSRVMSKKGKNKGLDRGSSEVERGEEEE